MNWFQYSKRRGNMSLQTFVEGCSTIEEALGRFASKKIEDPPVEEVRKLFASDTKSQSDSSLQIVSESDAIEAPVVKKTKVVSGSTGN